MMEGGNVQKISSLHRDLTRVFSSCNKSSVLLKKNLKETNSFLREMRQNYSNVCAAGDLEQGETQRLGLTRVRGFVSVTPSLFHSLTFICFIFSLCFSLYLLYC